MRSFLLLCMFCLAIAMPQASGAAETAAVIKQISGTVVVIRDGKPTAASENMPVCSGDIIKTEKKAAVAISFSDGTRMTLGELSEFSVADYVFRPNDEQFSFDVLLKKGTSVYSSGKIGKVAPESVKIRTPQSVIGVRGTKLCIKVS